MNSIVELTLSAAAGALIGLLFFQGLWSTVRRIQEVRHPAALLLGSLLLRFAISLGGFYLLGRYGGWQQLLAGMAGFTLVRMLLLRQARTPGAGEEPGT